MAEQNMDYNYYFSNEFIYCKQFQILKGQQASMSEQNILAHHHRSNLLNSRALPFNTVYRDNQPRVRGSFFAQMLQNIKCSSYTREKLCHKDDNPGQENLAIVIEAKNLKCVPNSEEIIPFQQHNRHPSGPSKTFVIRSHPKKPASIERTTTKKLPQIQNFYQQIVITSQSYNFQALRELSSTPQFIERKQCKQLSNYNWAIVIPISILRKSLCVYSALFESFLESGFSIYVVVTNRNDKVKLLSSPLQEFCHILFYNLKDKSQGLFCWINFEEIPQTTKNFLILEGTDYPHSRIFPYAKDHKTKIGFIKISQLSKIKEIIQICETKVKIKIESGRNSHTKNGMGIKIEKFDIKSNVKLQLENIKRKRVRRKTKNSSFTQTEYPTLQNLQEKLLQYVKIVKKEGKQTIPVRINKKETQKSPFQVINQLIRNNTGISRQIQEYFEQTREVKFQEQSGLQCDQVIYTLVD